MAHPKDPAGYAGSIPNSPETSPPPDPPPPAETSTNEATPSPSEQSSGQQPVVEASVPATFDHPPIEPHTNLPLPHPPPPPHSNPPFNTHEFVKVLERSFPVPIARNLMRACRAMLVDRQGRVKRDGLTTQDLESQAYLFKAALSELRSETSVFTRNETAAMRAATMALRREVDALGSRMKEDVATLKHEIQMDLDSRKNEAKDDLKRTDLQMEEVLSRALITIGELKTQVEESRWEKMRAAVGALGVLTLVIIACVEVFVGQGKKNRQVAKTPPEIPIPLGDDILA